MPRCLSRHEHPSKTEAADCDWLLSRLQAGEIQNLKLYPSYPLHVKGKFWKAWKPDFYFEEKIIVHQSPLTGEKWGWIACIMESKGWNRSDDSFRLKLSAFLTQYEGIKVYVNRKPAYLSPGLRIMAAGLAKRKAERLVRTYDKKLGRMVTMKASDFLKRNKRR